MFRTDLVKLLYRELKYKVMQRNPMVSNDEERFKKKMKEAMNIKKKMLKQSSIFGLLGLMFASPLYLSPSQKVFSAILTSLALLPLIFTIYQTVIQTSYMDSLNIFRPLRMLPVDFGAYQLTALLSIDFLPVMMMLLPSLIVVSLYYPLTALLAGVWFITGLLLGHAIGLLIYSVFGLKLSHGGGRSRLIKSALRILGLIAFMSFFFTINYFQDYFIQRSELLLRYSVAYPLSVASIFQPFTNFITLILHLVLILPLYYFAVHRVWDGILEHKEISEEGSGGMNKRVSVRNSVISLFQKDLRIIFRKSAMIAGFLVPIYIIVPQLMMAVQGGGISMFQTTTFTFIVSLLAVFSTDAVLKVDGDSLDFLNMLPVRKRSYILGKVLTMSLMPMVMALFLTGLGAYYHLRSLYLVPLALLLPTTASMVTMAFLFRYRGEKIGTPDFGMGKMFLLFILVGFAFLLIGAPLLILDGWPGYVLAYIAASSLLFMSYRRISG